MIDLSEIVKNTPVPSFNIYWFSYSYFIKLSLINLNIQPCALGHHDGHFL